MVKRGRATLPSLAGLRVSAAEVAGCKYRSIHAYPSATVTLCSGAETAQANDRSWPFSAYHKKQK